MERTVWTSDFYFTPPCFWTIINSDKDKTFTYNNFNNDLNDYYKAVSDMTRGKPLTDDIGNFTPSAFLLSAPFYQEAGLKKHR